MTGVRRPSPTDGTDIELVIFTEAANDHLRLHVIIDNTSGRLRYLDPFSHSPWTLLDVDDEAYDSLDKHFENSKAKLDGNASAPS